MFKFNLGVVIFLLVFTSSCSTHQKRGKRFLASESALENQIDPKFEEFEDGSYEAEAAVHKKLITLSYDLMSKVYKSSSGRPMARDAHAKSHGCLKAKFSVDAKYMPKEARVGIFKEAKAYEAWVRYSNNDHLPMRKDNEFDLRGIAIKVMGVGGEKIMSGYEDAPTQDFLMYGSDIFFVKDNKSYVGFIKSLRDENSVKFLLRNEPKAAVKTLAAQFSMQHYINPLNPQYFSAVPIRLGSRDDLNRTAAKYRVIRCDKEMYEAPFGKKNHNYMRLNLKDSLSSGGACLKFQLQLQIDPANMPVEDSTVRWPQGISPYVTVATVEIPPQEFDTPQRDTHCENLSFTPWHSLIEHKPLGRTMRMRRDLYRATSGFRRATNRAKLEEPSGFEDIE